MPLDVYFQHDIQGGITSIAVAMLCTASAHGASNREYVRGVLDTLRAQATSFGIPWTSVSCEIRQALQDAGRGELVELVSRGMVEG